MKEGKKEGRNLVHDLMITDCWTTHLFREGRKEGRTEGRKEGRKESGEGRNKEGGEGGEGRKVVKEESW